MWIGAGSTWVLAAPKDLHWIGISISRQQTSSMGSLRLECATQAPRFSVSLASEWLVRRAGIDAMDESRLSGKMSLVPREFEWLWIGRMIAGQ